jgi:hypothetical protein
MLTFLLGRGKATDRKMRLFGCACCRLLWDLFPDPCNRDMVVAIEDHPDGAFSDPDLDGAICASSAREYEMSSNPVYWVAKYLGRGFYKLTAGASALTVARLAACTIPGGTAREAHMAEQADRLRDIFGPLPFRPATVHPHVLAWNDRLVVRLTQAIYDERRWGDMPLLGDALLDAGCDDDEVLAHCRAGGEHVRGCWVVDLLLGKV